MLSSLPPGVLNCVNGDKEAVDAILDDRISAPSALSARRRSRNIFISARRRPTSAQCFGGAKNHAIVDADMDQTVDALIGAGFGAAGERCMAISVAVPVGRRPRIV